MFSRKKSRVFFFILAIPSCFGICKHLMKRLITKYMDIFITETKNVALVERKESAFQL